MCKKISYSERDYENYMRAVDSKINEVKLGIKELPKWEIISELSYEDWCRWQSGSLNLEN